MPIPLVTKEILAVAANIEDTVSAEKMMLERDRALYAYCQELICNSPAPKVIGRSLGFVYIALDLQFKSSRVAFPPVRQSVLQDLKREIVGNVDWEADVEARMFATQRDLHSVCRAWCSGSARPEAARFGMATMYRIVEAHLQSQKA